MMDLSARLIVCIALASHLAFAAPATTSSCPKGHLTSTNVNAAFDDLPFNNLRTDPLPTPYNSLFWQSFRVVQPQAEGTAVPNLVPHSMPNVAGAGLGSEIETGTIILSTIYTNSATVDFDLHSFWYGCELSRPNTVTAPPQACSVTVTGYKGLQNDPASGQEVCAQTFTFNPTVVTGPQQLAFSGPITTMCSNLNFAVFSFMAPGGQAPLNDLVVLDLDNVQYTVRTCK